MLRYIPPILKPSSRFIAWLDDWWLALCCIGFILGSDYKFRVRDPAAALSGGIDSSILIELALYGVAGIYVVTRHVRMRLPSRPPAALFLMYCFVGLVLLSVTYSEYPQYSLVRALQMLIIVLVVIAAIEDASRAHFHRFAHAFLVLVALSVVYGMLNPAPAVNRLQVGRFTWLAIHPTVSGVLTSLATVIAVAYLCAGRRPRSGPRWEPLIYVGLLILVGTGMLMTQTRGAVAGAFIAMTFILGALLPRKWFVDFIISLVVVVTGIAIAFNEVIVAYFARGGDSSDIATLNSRTELWTVAMSAIQRNPLFGHGVTSSRGIFYAEVGLGGGHNAAINVIVELGIIGFSVWAATVIVTMLGVRKLPTSGHDDVRLDRALLMGVIIFLMVDGIFFEGPGAVANVASTWFFVCIAWFVVIRRDLTAAKRSTNSRHQTVRSTLRS